MIHLSMANYNFSMYTEGSKSFSHFARTAFDTGLAGIAAAEEVKQRMKSRAALLWEVQDEDVDFGDGVFICTKNPEDKFTFKELSGRLMRTGGPVTCSASAPSTGVGPIFAGNIVDVEVDPETGKVEILRYTAFLDAGQAVHPSFVEGQMQGATVQGIGWALNEEYFYHSDGTMANSSFIPHRLSPTNRAILPLTSATCGCNSASASSQRSTNRL